MSSKANYLGTSASYTTPAMLKKPFACLSATPSSPAAGSIKFSCECSGLTGVAGCWTLGQNVVFNVGDSSGTTGYIFTFSQVSIGLNPEGPTP